MIDLPASTEDRQIRRGSNIAIALSIAGLLAGFNYIGVVEEMVSHAKQDGATIEFSQPVKGMMVYWPLVLIVFGITLRIRMFRCAQVTLYLWSLLTVATLASLVFWGRPESLDPSIVTQYQGGIVLRSLAVYLSPNLGLKLSVTVAHVVILCVPGYFFNNGLRALSKSR